VKVFLTDDKKLTRFFGAFGLSGECEKFPVPFRGGGGNGPPGLAGGSEMREIFLEYGEEFRDLRCAVVPQRHRLRLLAAHEQAEIGAPVAFHVFAEADHLGCRTGQSKILVGRFFVKAGFTLPIDLAVTVGASPQVLKSVADQFRER